MTPVYLGVHSVYLGGPVDYASHDPETAWQHWVGWRSRAGLVPYCPKCECTGLSAEKMVEQNFDALMAATVVVLDLRSHSIGTPIEMYWRAIQQGASAILIAKPGSKMVEWVLATNPHTTLVSTPEEALGKAVAHMQHEVRKNT